MFAKSFQHVIREVLQPASALRSEYGVKLSKKTIVVTTTKTCVQDLLPGYRETTEAYVRAMTQLGLRLVKLLALALRLPANFFDDKFEKPMTFLRPLHYTDDVSSEKDGLFAAGQYKVLKAPLVC